MLLTDIKDIDKKTTDEIIEEIRKHHKKESENFEEKWKEKQRQEQLEKYNTLIEHLAKEKENKVRQEQIVGSALCKYEAEAKTKGKIMDHFIERHLEAKIIAARWALALGVAATFLFKGQWLMWIAFTITYFLYVNKLKADAIEADKRRKDFGKKK